MINADERIATKAQAQPLTKALKPTLEPADFSVSVQGSDTTMFNRNPAACNIKKPMFISRMLNSSVLACSKKTLPSCLVCAEVNKIITIILNNSHRTD